MKNKIALTLLGFLLVGCDAMYDHSSVVDRKLMHMTVEVYRERSGTGFYAVFRDQTGRVWEWETGSTSCKQSLNLSVGHTIDIVARTTQTTNRKDESRNFVKQELILCP